MRIGFVYLFFIVMASFVMITSPLLADPGDTTVVQAFSNEFHNWAANHDSTFSFPDGSVSYSQVSMVYRISCPGAPGDCDPWDRCALLAVLRPVDSTLESVEIARVITPYDITGLNYPGTCSWEFDMTPYLPLLQDSVRLRSYIETWIGGTRGWLITVTFYFIEGEMSQIPYRVQTLWDQSHLVVGDPNNPPENHLPETLIETDAYTTSLQLRVTTTGHGQGNADNAAEFSRTTHGLWAGEQNFQHQFWRDDCSANPCSPQGGTWRYARAGWCPGSAVYPWDITDINFNGTPFLVHYQLNPYENQCRPTNPECIVGPNCLDCNYNSTGHTEPFYWTVGQLIYYRSSGQAVHPVNDLLPHDVRLEQNSPNPFNAQTTIRYSLRGTARVKLSIYDLTGREVAVAEDGIADRGEHTVRFDGSNLSSGVYFYSLRSSTFVETRKMILLK